MLVVFYKSKKKGTSNLTISTAVLQIDCRLIVVNQGQLEEIEMIRPFLCPDVYPEIFKNCTAAIFENVGDNRVSLWCRLGERFFSGPFYLSWEEITDPNRKEIPREVQKTVRTVLAKEENWNQTDTSMNFIRSRLVILN